MLDDLGTLLVRAEHVKDGTFTPHDTRAWPQDRLAEFVSLDILSAGTPAREIVYTGCDRECVVALSGFERHPQDDNRIVCVHHCVHGCGRVVLDAHDFDTWRFNLSGLAQAVKQAIHASGSLVEDVPGRVVLLGNASVAGIASEVFLGYGLARTDAFGVIASASRLAAAENPVILSVGVKPANLWPQLNQPVTAVLAEHAILEPGGLRLDLGRVFPMSAVLEARQEVWITVTAAATMLLDDVSGIDLGKAKARVSKAAGESRFRTNGLTGKNRRIDRDSFSTWRLEQRAKDLDAYDSNR